jgi:hypothetical protein
MAVGTIGLADSLFNKSGLVDIKRQSQASVDEAKKLINHIFSVYVVWPCDPGPCAEATDKEPAKECKAFRAPQPGKPATATTPEEKPIPYVYGGGTDEVDFDLKLAASASAPVDGKTDISANIHVHLKITVTAEYINFDPITKCAAPKCEGETRVVHTKLTYDGDFQAHFTGQASVQWGLAPVFKTDTKGNLELSFHRHVTWYDELSVLLECDKTIDVVK